VGVASERVKARVRRDFEVGSAEVVLARLDSLSESSSRTDEGLERVQAAIILAARGDYELFNREVALAEIDWRDVLVAGGLANEDWRETLANEFGPAEPGRS
jgi:hypothetical protein